MTTLIRAAAALLAVALAGGRPTRAGAASLKHEKSVYADDKEGALKRPEGVACDDKGAFVVADTGNGRLVTFAWKGGILTGGAEVKIAQLPYPVRVQIDSKGNVLVLDRRQKQIVRLDAAGAFAGVLEAKGASGAAPVPASFKLDAEDAVYVLDVAAARVLVTDPGGKVTRELPLPRDGAVFTDIAVDAAGRVLAVDAVQAVVWSAAKNAKGFQPLTKSLKDRMSFPGYLTSVQGRIFVVDQNGDGIVVLGGDGTFLGRELAMGRADGTLYYPAQLCVNAMGDAFVADRGNNRVQVFTTSR